MKSLRMLARRFLLGFIRAAAPVEEKVTYVWACQFCNNLEIARAAKGTKKPERCLHCGSGKMLTLCNMPDRVLEHYTLLRQGQR